MTRPNDPAEDEYAVLTTEEGLDLLAEVAAIPEPRPADLERWRRGASPGRVAAAMRLAGGRRKGRAKFDRAERMWLEPVGLEQATAQPVARHKARRFAGSAVLDLCSGLGGDAIALAGVGRVVAVDLDPARGRRLRWNAGVYGVADRLLAVRGRAERFAVADDALVHIDPDRRARPGGVRARRVEDYAPGLGFLLALPGRTSGGAIKLGPASDFEGAFGDGFEVELISLDGECKEATAWYGSLATCRRRATRLPAGFTWTDLDTSGQGRAPIAPPRGLVFDPDPALIRAGLLDGFARAHGLSRLAEGIDFLTGPSRVGSPWMSEFEVLDVLTLDTKRLRRLVTDRGLGPLEIKTKGLDLRPEELRRRLRPEGTAAATLILHGGPGPARAILARRLPAHDRPGMGSPR